MLSAIFPVAKFAIIIRSELSELLCFIIKTIDEIAVWNLFYNILSLKYVFIDEKQW